MQSFEIEPLLVAALVGLLFKIVWDWLSGFKKKDKENEHCENHEDCMKRISDCESCLRQQQTHITGMIATFEERTASIMRELERGNKNFDRIDESINEIRSSMAELTGLFKKGRN